ncbi:S-layer homology domain-containing protein [Paenibacillus sp. FA6]|uniref:S-layer homology domain-containing protein n=1 Tax=Paenibacillus sp. FA6 TaxID=3413029 RepID=UPI003F6607BB
MGCPSHRRRRKPLTIGTHYSIDGGTITIKQTYLATLTDGTVTLGFTFSAGANQSLIITVSNSTPSGGDGSGNTGGGSSPTPETKPVDKVEPTKQRSFSDINGHWAEGMIKQAVEQGIVKGYPDDIFKPNATVTRAEFTVMLMNAIKPISKGAELSFGDAKQIGIWAQTAVRQAVAEGIMSGYSNGTFRPSAVITRAELAVMIAKVAGITSTQVSPTGFADDSEIPDWSKSAIAGVKKLGNTS